MNVASATVSPERARRSVLTPAELQALKARDNWTNWRYLAGNWAVIVATIGGAIWAENALAAGGYSFWWMVPIAAVAITIIGASQHQLGGAIHEGAHYQLFANRTLNEVASDWLAGFPIYTSTHHYRLHHLPHHQFVNDRARDPIFSQADESGHWLDFPLTHVELTKALLRLLWVPGLIKYTVARARYSALGKGANPYTDPNKPGRPSTTIIGALFAALLPVILIVMIVRDVSAPVVLGTWAAIWAVTLIYYWLIPDEWYAKGRVDSVVPHRFGAFSRISFMALVLWCADRGRPRRCRRQSVGLLRSLLGSSAVPDLSGVHDPAGMAAARKCRPRPSDQHAGISDQSAIPLCCPAMGNGLSLAPSHDGERAALPAQGAARDPAAGSRVRRERRCRRRHVWPCK